MSRPRDWPKRLHGTDLDLMAVMLAQGDVVPPGKVRELLEWCRFLYARRGRLMRRVLLLAATGVIGPGELLAARADAAWEGDDQIQLLDAERSPKRYWFKPKRQRSRVQREAHAAVQRALRSGELVRPTECESCGRVGRLGRPLKLLGHHFLGYAAEHRLHLRWLCEACHGQAHSKAKLVAEEGNQMTETEVA